MSSSPQRRRVVDPTANSRLLRSGSRQTPATGPPPSAIQDVPTLPTRTEFLSNKIIPLKSAPPGTQCSICVEAVTSDIVKVCPNKHIFHSECIGLWFEGNEERNRRCPNCAIRLFRPNPSSVVPAEQQYPRAIDADHNMINDPPEANVLSLVPPLQQGQEVEPPAAGACANTPRVPGRNPQTLSDERLEEALAEFRTRFEAFRDFVSANRERFIAFESEFAQNISLAREEARSLEQLLTDVEHMRDVHNQSARARRRSTSPRDRETQDAKRLRRSARLA